MKLTEGLGLVNNLIFFRSFFFLRGLNLSVTRSCSVSVFYFLVMFRVDWKEGRSWMDVNALKSGLLLLLSFASAPKKGLSTDS